MSITIEAIYENGVLKPVQPLPLEEQAHVQITIHATPSIAQQSAGLIPWKGDPETLERLACDDEHGILESP